MTGDRRATTGVVAALVLAGALLRLPAPAEPATPDGSTRPAPATLASTWPAARLFTIPSLLPDGASYRPGLIVDPTAALGTALSADGTQVSLVLLDAGTPRVLHTEPVARGVSYDNFTATADRLFWLRVASDPTGQARFTLHGAGRRGGPVTLVTADVGAPRFAGSQHDLQIVGDRLVWAAATTGDRRGGPGGTEIRSVALTGGRVQRRALAGEWVPAAWPWLLTAPGQSGGTDPELYNLDTGARTPVRAPANRDLTCSVTWCRTVSATGGPLTVEIALVRPDGSDQRRIGDRSVVSALADVALLDRFEVLIVPDHAATRTASALALYDIAGSRSVRIDPAVTDVGARDGYLWWHGYNGDTPTWYVLDLRTLS